MSIATDQALIESSAGGLGYWFGGFILPMAVAYVLLRFAGSAKRRPATAIVLRILAILVALFLAYAGYVGGGGQINPGGLLAVAVTIAWALKQQFARSGA